MDMREGGLFNHTSKRVSRSRLNSSRDEFPERRGRALVRNWIKSLPIIGHQSTKRRLAQGMGFFEDRLEHRREIAGRGVDDTQHLGPCGSGSSARSGATVARSGIWTNRSPPTSRPAGLFGRISMPLRKIFSNGVATPW